MQIKPADKPGADTPPNPPEQPPEETRVLKAAKDYVPKLGGVVLFGLGPHDGHFGRINGARVHPAIITRVSMDDSVNLHVLADATAPFFVTVVLRGKPGESRRWFTRPEFDALPLPEQRNLS